MAAAKIIGTALCVIAIGLFLFIHELGRFTDDIYPYNQEEKGENSDDN